MVASTRNRQLQSSLTPTSKPTLNPPPPNTPNTPNNTTNMSPTYTMSAHLCKQIYSSWIQTRNDALPSPPISAKPVPNAMRRSPSPSASDDGKRSMDDDSGRRSSLGSSPPGSGWTWQRR